MADRTLRNFIRLLRPYTVSRELAPQVVYKNIHLNGFQWKPLKPPLIRDCHGLFEKLGSQASGVCVARVL